MHVHVYDYYVINEFRCYEAKIEESEKAALPLAAQARGVLGSTPDDCQLFHFPLFSPHNI